MKKIIFYIYKKCWDIIANPSVNYLENKLKHNTYLKDNPIVHVAKKKFINIH